MVKRPSEEPCNKCAVPCAMSRMSALVRYCSSARAVPGRGVEAEIDGRTLAIGSTRTVQLFGEGSARPADNHSAIVEFLVDDVDEEYEKLIEGNSYIGELSGKPKEKESIFGVLRSFGILRKRYGKVAVNFGEPILLDHLLDSKDWALSERPRRMAEDSSSCGAMMIALTGNVAGSPCQ